VTSENFFPGGTVFCPEKTPVNLSVSPKVLTVYGGFQRILPLSLQAEYNFSFNITTRIISTDFLNLASHASKKRICKKSTSAKDRATERI